MSSDAVKSASESLTKLIDALDRATGNAGKGEQTAVETSLQLMEQLKQIKVNTEVLVATQGGKRVRKLTKHVDMNIKAAAAELVNTWKGIVAAEAAAVEKGKEQLGGLQPADAVVSPGVPSQGTASNDSDRASKRQKVEADATPVKREPASSKPLSVPKTGVEARDKIRMQLAEALQLAAADVPEGDAGARAADIEAAVLQQNGGINPKYKAKIRSIWVNLKDSKNPDFRRSVLLGEITGEEAVNLKPEEMASRTRQEENQRIREAAMFEAERGKKRLATTDQFQCSKCKKRQTSYYQMQTRSADEPMTTFVICQNCDNRWKFC